MVNPYNTPNERLLVDFDFTLYKTDEFAQDLWQELSSQSGLPQATVAADGERFHMHPGLGGYDFEAHINSYDLDRELLWKKLGDIATSKDYLYEDSRPFIQELRGDGYAPSILSFGETRYQAAKIEPVLDTLVGVDTGQLLPFQVIMQRKGPYIARQYPGERGALVDDVKRQHLPKGFLEIHIDRSSSQSAPKKKWGGFAVANLTQAYDVITTAFPR